VIEVQFGPRRRRTVPGVLTAPNDPLETTSDFITEDSSSPFSAIDETRSAANVSDPLTSTSSPIKFVSELP
jgi:hypothetical protein